MGAQRGKDILLKIGDGGSPEAFTAVAGLRARTISLNAKTVDATDSDSAGRWRELLAGAGVRSASVSGAGIFRDAASDALVREAFFAAGGAALALGGPGLRGFRGAVPGGGAGVRGRARGRGDLCADAGVGGGGDVCSRVTGRGARL